jgi:WD40 repeat protein
MLVPIAPPEPGTEHSDWTRVLENGVILLDATKSAAPQAPQVLIQSADNQSVIATEWDLTTGTAIPVAGVPQASTFSTLPPALSYSWGTAGALVPQSPLPLAASQGSPPIAPLSAIGTPNRGVSFTIWQPGLTATTIPQTATQPSVSGIFQWSTSIAAWSPDGRYLIESLDLSGLLVSSQTPAPSASDLNTSGLGQAPLLPVRDAALQAVYPIAQNAPFYGGPEGFTTNGVLLAWRPDGRYLAVDADTNDRHLALYNCQTGRLVATLHPYITNIPSVGYVSKQQSEANVVRWSPDGSQLLLLDTQLGTATIWDSQQLPR